MILELDGKFLHQHYSDRESDCRRLLVAIPAMQRYKEPLFGIKAQEMADPCESCLYIYPGDLSTR